jgi:hypothetical protein
VASRVDRAEVWHWYKVVREFEESEMLQKRFCTERGYDYKTFVNRYTRIVWKSKSHPELYARVVPLGQKFLKSGMRPSDFVKIHDIDIKTLSSLATHLNYINVIEEMKSRDKASPMQFIQLPSVQQRPAMEPEVLKKQNDVELIISAGVKVIVAPDVGADKLIRIIELLKDL